jgi:hypothetical protein
MLLTIDNFDSAGPRDYTAALEAAPALKITRRLNHASRMEFSLAALTPALLVPRVGARVLLSGAGEVRLFTGYVDSPPRHEYLGWGERGPMHRLFCSCTSDEFLLDSAAQPARPAFVNRTAGDALRALTSALLPGAFNLAAVADLDRLSLVLVSRELRWSDHAREIAFRARAAYRAHDGAVSLAALGAVQHSFSEADPRFCPDGLRLKTAPAATNQITIVGKGEPRLWVSDYFLGDGVTAGFFMSNKPFLQHRFTILDDTFSGTALDPLRWLVSDPAHAISVSNGKLLLAGGSGGDGATTVSFAEPIELGGGYSIQHGAITPTADCNGILGGLYDAAASPAVVAANCLAGFLFSTTIGQVSMQAIVNGAAVGSPIALQLGQPYTLTTLLHSSAIHRRGENFYSSQHPAGNPRTAPASPAGVYVLLIVQNAAPGSAQTPQVLFDGALASAPAYARYAAVNGGAFNASLQYTLISRESEAMAQSAPAGQGWHTRLLSGEASGPDCEILTTRELKFFAGHIPAAGERVVVRYRAAGRALAQATDSASIAGQAQNAGRGVRFSIASLTLPVPATTADCEQAALAVLDDSVQPAFTGQYHAPSLALDDDPWPGDGLAFNLPSQHANFTATARQVELTLLDAATNLFQYAIDFSNDAATPFSLELVHSTSKKRSLGNTTVIPIAGASYLPDLTAAQITDVSNGQVTIDCGIAPLSGGGIEVRRGDSGWGLADDYNLLGRFTTQSFSLPKMTRTANYYLRQFDRNGTYSRYSALLHVDQP